MKRLLSLIVVLFAAWPAQSAGTAPVDTPNRIRWAYYVPYDTNSLTSLKEHLAQLDYVSPFWFYLDDQGNIEDRNNPEVTNLLKSRGVKNLPTFRNNARGSDFHTALTDPTIREKSLASIVRLVDRYNYDGVNIDFEDIEGADRPILTQFMADLARQLRSKGKLVTQAVPAKEQEKTTGWAGAFDYAALGQINDFVLLMAYGYRTANSTVPGSTAPLSWVEATVSYTVSQIPAHKLILGVPWYGYDWNRAQGPPAKSLRYAESMTLASQNGAAIEYKGAEQGAYFSYTQSGEPHEVWFENKQSVEAKLELMNKYGLAGAGGWRLGHEDPGVWESFNARLGFRTWLLAEGCTCSPFDTWILIMNPSDTRANTTVTFMKEDGGTVTKSYSVAPHARFNIFANQVLPDAAFSTKVESDQPVLVERSMYFGNDGHNSPGVTGGSRVWYLPEGYGGSGYQTWILIMNPNPYPAKATATFMKEDGSTVSRTYTLAPTSRKNIFANEIVPNASFSTRVEADQPVVVERAMYFGGGGGHGAVGSPYTAKTWYLAEGYTGHDTWILIMNPNPQPAKAKVTFMKEDGANVIRDYSLKPTSRTTINVNTVLPNTAFSTRIEADQPVVVERSAYWGNPRAGHSSLATSSPSTTWFFPEGSTAPPFLEWILIENPNSSPANLRLTLMKEGGSTLTRDYSAGPFSRLTLFINEIWPDAALSARLDSDQPIVAERAMYFGEGGHSSMGIAR